MSRHPNRTTKTTRKSVPAPRYDRDGASRQRCDDTCVRPTPSQAHCAGGCHRTFGGITGFDHHRRDGRCIDPATLGMALTDVGIWRVPMSDDAKARFAGRTPAEWHDWDELRAEVAAVVGQERIDKAKAELGEQMEKR